MKYIRTNDINNLIIDLSHNVLPYMIVNDCIDFNRLGRFKIIRQADTIEELCDDFVYKHFDSYELCDIKTFDVKGTLEYFNAEIYGAIWTEWGLKYVAKMNDKGELELL